MEYPVRTRFSHDIVAEVLLPERQTGKVAILATGLPAAPVKRGVLQFLANQGYVAIAPRYRGTWESQGQFLAQSPATDIRDVIRELGRKGNLVDLASGKRIKIRVANIHLFGSSFGGPAVLLNSSEKLVKKVVALSPVLDWSLEGPDEPFDFFLRFTREAFGDAFRVAKQGDWQKLRSPHFYNPLSPRAHIEGKKVLILQAMDDTITLPARVRPFAERTGANYYLKPKGGHFGLSVLQRRFFWKKIAPFLRST